MLRDRDYNRDPNIKDLKRRGFIHQGSTIGKRGTYLAFALEAFTCATLPAGRIQFQAWVSVKYWLLANVARRIYTYIYVCVSNP